ncbi:tetratricopeptide repeat protein [Alloalcanivorax marinus]|uniref:tetratricopeptide repeat protein n=1 Tax=Alloalcanivorax marinus TaxID=1177169 RepID=UPI0019330B1A|nr:hypothetical protein [Alloalcanivorax marinus]MBL7251336.1 hypothetical protein [Alloalcanivorax marinus]
MSSKSYGFSVAHDRWRVIGPLELLVLALLVVLVCWLVFPRDLSSILRNARMDAVTLSYARTWLQARPDDYELRLLMARDLIELGLFEQAEEQLDYVAGQSNQRELLNLQAWLRARLPFVALMALPAEERADSPISVEAGFALRRVDPTDLGDDEVRRYADMALLLGNLDAAVRAYHLLAERQPSPSTWYRQAATDLLAHGRYRAAANEYLLAMESQTDPALRRADFLQALATLQAGGLLDQALAVGRRQGPAFADQPEVLYRLMNLARAAGDHRQAQFYATRLLRLDADPTPVTGDGA